MTDMTEPKKQNQPKLTTSARAIRKWRGKRGALIMVLHEIQNQIGFVPRETALEIAEGMSVPLARVYEVITFYNYFKLLPPGKAVISVCTGTACHLKGAPELVAELKQELGISEGETTPDGLFHLQCVRCVGCCGLAPAISVNGKIYGKAQPSQIKQILSEWRLVFRDQEQKDG